MWVFQISIILDKLIVSLGESNHVTDFYCYQPARVMLISMGKSNKKNYISLALFPPFNFYYFVFQWSVVTCMLSCKFSLFALSLFLFGYVYSGKRSAMLLAYLCSVITFSFYLGFLSCPVILVICQ